MRFVSTFGNHEKVGPSATATATLPEDEIDEEDLVYDLALKRKRAGFGYLFKEKPDDFSLKLHTDDDLMKMDGLGWNEMLQRLENHRSLVSVCVFVCIVIVCLCYNCDF